MNKCEFCEESINVDGKFTCPFEEDDIKPCNDAIEIMIKTTNNFVPMEKCNYCVAAIFNSNGFRCQGFNQDCKEALKLMVDIKTNNISAEDKYGNCNN